MGFTSCRSQNERLFFSPVLVPCMLAALISLGPWGELGSVPGCRWAPFPPCIDLSRVNSALRLRTAVNHRDLFALASQAESKANVFLEAPGLACPGVRPPSAAVPLWGSTQSSVRVAGSCRVSRLPREAEHPGGCMAAVALGALPTGRAQRLFCALCNVALVTLASFPLHGFSKPLAAPPPPCALALAARPRPAGNALPARTRDATPCSAVCFWGREARPGRLGWLGSRGALAPRLGGELPRRRLRALPQPGPGEPAARCVWAGWQ